MKHVLLIMAVALGQSDLAADKKPLTKEKSARHAKVIEAAIRIAAKKPTGELTKEDFEKVTNLWLEYKKLTSVKGLMLKANPDLTKAQIDELKKALPKCKIYSNPTK